MNKAMIGCLPVKKKGRINGNSRLSHLAQHMMLIVEEILRKQIRTTSKIRFKTGLLLFSVAIARNS